MTTETLELLLNKLPPKARRAFRVPDIQHNLIACAELINAGCSVYLHKHGCEIVYKGETLYKGWRDTINKMWRINVAQDATNRITPYTNTEEYKDSTRVVLGADAEIKWSLNSMYEFANTKQLMKYHHASLESHSKRTLVAAIKRGYLKEFKGLTAERVNTHISVWNTQRKRGTCRPFPKACDPQPQPQKEAGRKRASLTLKGTRRRTMPLHCQSKFRAMCVCVCVNMCSSEGELAIMDFLRVIRQRSSQGMSSI